MEQQPERKKKKWLTAGKKALPAVLLASLAALADVGLLNGALYHLARTVVEVVAVTPSA